MNRLLCAVLALGLLAGSMPALAQEGQSSMTTLERVEEQLQELKVQLNLSEYQWSQVERILKSSIRERVAIAQRYGLTLDASSWASLDNKQKRAMKRDLKENRKDTTERMKRYLDKDQMKAFKAVQEEIHSKVLTKLGG